jgi:NitT/TauT family transport system substrate-binding protein
VGHALTRADKGWFEERVGPETKIEWFTYNAGPSAMEALLAGSIDLTYVGPSPALNAHLKSQGTDVRVVAGAARGGSALVVKAEGGLKGPEDFRGKKVATPQFGNTQDVAARAWLVGHGFKVTQTGGDVSVIPTQNADQLLLFQRGELDAVWTVEPWVSRLEREAGGKVLVDDRESPTTLLVASAKMQRERPEVLRKFVDAHRELTRWIVAHEAEAKALVRAELKAETRQDMPAELLDHCWPRIRLDDAVRLEDFTSFVKAAQAVGFLKDAGSLDALVSAER